MAAVTLSKAAINRAGDRLRDDAAARPEDVAIYNEYRASLMPTLSEVVTIVRVTSDMQGEPGARPKRVESVIAKLRRQPTLRLSSIQDIVGCRLVVEHISEQDAVVAKLQRAFPGCRVIDRRVKPNRSGYRAVHLVVSPRAGQTVEIQVRTRRQHSWAQLSEALAAVAQIGPEIKYGGGPQVPRDALAKLAQADAHYETEVEPQADELLRQLATLELREPARAVALQAEVKAILDEAEAIRSRAYEQIHAGILALKETD